MKGLGESEVGENLKELDELLKEIIGQKQKQALRNSIFGADRQMASNQPAPKTVDKDKETVQKQQRNPVKPQIIATKQQETKYNIQFRPPSPRFAETPQPIINRAEVNYFAAKPRSNSRPSTVYIEEVKPQQAKSYVNTYSVSTSGLKVPAHLKPLKDGLQKRVESNGFGFFEKRQTPSRLLNSGVASLNPFSEIEKKLAVFDIKSVHGMRQASQTDGISKWRNGSDQLNTPNRILHSESSKITPKLQDSQYPSVDSLRNFRNQLRGLYEKGSKGSTPGLYDLSMRTFKSKLI